MVPVPDTIEMPNNRDSCLTTMHATGGDRYEMLVYKKMKYRRILHEEDEFSDVENGTGELI